MKVILLKDIENVGKKYEVCDVKPGYARNFLLPEGSVKLATKANMEWLESQRTAIEQEMTEDLRQTQELASALDGLEVAMEVNVGDDNQLFESINAAKVAERLKEMGHEVKKSQIQLKDPVKQVGEFEVKITLPHNLESEINLIITGKKEAKM